MKDTFLYNFGSLKDNQKMSIQFMNGHGVVLTNEADIAVITCAEGRLVSILTQENILIKVPFNNICYWIITE